MKTLIFFLLVSFFSSSQDSLVIEIDSLMRIKTITFSDQSKRVYEYRENGIYLMRLYNTNGTISSTVIDRMDIEEMKEDDIKPLGHIYRLR